MMLTEKQDQQIAAAKITAISLGSIGAKIGARHGIAGALGASSALVPGLAVGLVVGGLLGAVAVDIYHEQKKKPKPLGHNIKPRKVKFSKFQRKANLDTEASDGRFNLNDAKPADLPTAFDGDPKL